MKKIFLAVLLMLVFGISKAENKDEKTNPPIYIAFLWHMHQPIYWPYESIVQTESQNRYPYSVFSIHDQRTGPYTAWPKNAVQKGINANMPHFGAQVSFSGSLIENLNNLEAYGNGNFTNWKNNWNTIKTQKTSLGNPRLDMVAFGYFHPLMGLIDYGDIRKQIQKHKETFSQNFSGNYSKGIFPPENAFTNRMIPALVDEGIEWVLVDNIHFERACIGFPFNTGGNLYEPNKADIFNPNPNDWVQLNNVWAPTKVSGKWGHQPHYVSYINPETGIQTKIVAVPADRYLGNEDGRGGFGALNYESVLSQLESYNTDPNHPILVVLAHDGDNYGGGSDSYYNSNFQNFVNWLQNNPSRFVCTTVQDYLQMFPPDINDVIHVEDGSWSGADNGDPEFKKWLGDPGSNGYSPDRNSWSVLTAVKNSVLTAEQINPNNQNTKDAWKYLLVGETSCYWYWDGSLNGIWDDHPTRAANLAYSFSQQVSGNDLTPPTIFIPQRKPYNPGSTEWGIVQTNNVKIWSYVYDISGLQYVKLKYRVSESEILTSGSFVYNGGIWNEIEMTGTDIPSMTSMQPTVKSKEFNAEITGLNDKMIDYYIEAKDNNGNISKSPLKHVWIGNGTGGGTTTGGVSWQPLNPTINDTITVTVGGAPQGANLHWGVNTWTLPNQVYWTPGTLIFGSGPSVESPFGSPDSSGTIKIKLGPFNNSLQNVSSVDFVIHFNDNTWNNNNGQDYHITISGGGSGTTSFTMDGNLDENVRKLATNNNTDLYVGWNGTELYVATQSAPSLGKDVFVFLTDSLGSLRTAPWAKSGKVINWDAFLANESTNNYSGWTDNAGNTGKASGTFLEGTINIIQEYGYIPAYLYLSVGNYNTNDAGALLNQIPTGNGNTDIEANEFAKFDYTLVSLEETINGEFSFSLEQNYPNPFNPSTRINYSIPANMRNIKTNLEVYDILGNKVATLVDQNQVPGFYSVDFNASKFSSGVYFYKLTYGEYSITKKMALIK